VTWVVWLGILANIGLIFYTVSDGTRFSAAALLGLTADRTTAAVNAFNRGDFTAAIREADAALAEDPSNTAAGMTLTRALIYRSYVDFQYEDDLSRALEAASEVLADNPADANALAARAFALQANGAAVEAVEVAERALALDATHTLARTALALGYARVGSFDRALQESTAAVETAAGSPEAFDARRAVAISTADLGDYAAAGALLDDLIAAYSGIIPIYYERALYARQVSDMSAAENAYFTVLTMDEANIKARLRLCEFASAAGERDSAFRHCEQVTTDAPDLAAGWYQLGRVHFLAGDFAAAQATFNACSTLQMEQNTPPDARIFECWYLQGQAAEIVGDCASLVAIYNQFQVLATDSRVRETWTYPPEGPPMCQQPAGQ
jgi:tetratricopeptide (TPR) repeat protein